MKYKLLVLLICFFVAQKLYSQEMSYVVDENAQLTVQTLKQTTFKPFVKSINNGLKTGIYWLKVDKANNRYDILQINSNHIKNVTAFAQGKIIKSIPISRFPSYKISTEKFPIYFKVEVTKEAYIPIKLFKQEAFILHEQRQLLLMGLFYGFMLMVIIVNLFYYFNFHDRSFAYYAVFLLSVGLTFAHRDGLLELIGVSKHSLYYSDIFMHTITGFLGSLFAIEYLQLKKNFPKFIYSLYFVIAVSLVFDLLFLYSNNFLYFVLSDFFIYYVFIGCWFISLLLFKKYSYAVYFCVAYSLMVVLVFAFFIAPSIAMASLVVDESILKIGAYFEMLIITFAVVVRMRILQDENQQMHDEIIAYTQQLQALTQNSNQVSSNKIDYMSKFDLSSRENEILELITQNKSNKEIARKLFISVNTVKYHIKKLYQKLHIKNRKQVKTILKPS